jgi:hypothetical protein
VDAYAINPNSTLVTDIRTFVQLLAPLELRHVLTARIENADSVAVSHFFGWLQGGTHVSEGNGTKRRNFNSDAGPLSNEESSNFKRPAVRSFEIEPTLLSAKEACSQVHAAHPWLSSRQTQNPTTPSRSNSKSDKVNHLISNPSRSSSTVLDTEFHPLDFKSSPLVPKPRAHFSPPLTTPSPVPHRRYNLRATLSFQDNLPSEPSETLDTDINLNLDFDPFPFSSRPSFPPCTLPFRPATALYTPPQNTRNPQNPAFKRASMRGQFDSILDTSGMKFDSDHSIRCSSVPASDSDTASTSFMGGDDSPMKQRMAGAIDLARVTRLARPQVSMRTPPNAPHIYYKPVFFRFHHHTVRSGG